MKNIQIAAAALTVSAFLLACNGAPENTVASANLPLTNEQAAMVAKTDSSFRVKKDSINKQYEAVLGSTNFSDAQKDSIKLEKKQRQMALKLMENEALSKTLDGQQLAAYQQQKEKKPESAEEKTTKKIARLKEEYSLTDEQTVQIQPLVAKAEKEKEAIKKKYPGEGKDKSPETKKEEKAAKEKTDLAMNEGMQKFFTPAQNEKLQQKLAEKKKKEMEKYEKD